MECGKFQSSIAPSLEGGHDGRPLSPQNVDLQIAANSAGISLEIKRFPKTK
jgi:hypothetical protein